ncbi:MAG: lysozyme [Betaproteobacteria bacterium]|nr:lysozyme [Betaproteobacteria bacterium]
MARLINDLGLELIQHFEGFVPAAYKCPAGVWTIGYGSTGPHVKRGMTITQDEAEELLLRDIARFEKAVDAATYDVSTTDNQFAALVSLAFNIGIGAFSRSTVLRKHRYGETKGAADAFLMWTKAAGRTLSGLVRRREAERRLYLLED